MVLNKTKVTKTKLEYVINEVFEGVSKAKHVEHDGTVVWLYYAKDK